MNRILITAFMLSYLTGCGSGLTEIYDDINNYPDGGITSIRSESPASGNVTITWNNPNNINIAGYYIKYVNDAGTEITSPEIVSPTTTCSITGLTNGKDYTFKLYVHFNNGVIIYRISNEFMPAIYVNAAAVGANNGYSWTDAFTDLQDALAVASTSGQVIFVAKGTYSPTFSSVPTLADRGQFYKMRPGVAIYGGFTGSETKLNQRNYKMNITTLSGNIGNQGINTDNSYHVIQNYNAAGIDKNAVIDGFVISDGYADGSGDKYGAGIYNGGSPSSAPTIRNCEFKNNYALLKGSAVYISAAPDDMLIENCIFENNTSESYGGAVSYALPVGGYKFEIANCLFINNTSNTGYGGALRVDNNGSGTPSYLTNIVNCVFVSNSSPDAAWGGGAISFSGATTNDHFSLYNCTIVNNDSPGRGGAISMGSVTLEINNCILYGNTSARATGKTIADTGTVTGVINTQNSCYDGTYPIDFDRAVTSSISPVHSNPSFVSVPDNLNLQSSSVCKDRGSNSLYNALFSSFILDVEGKTRIDNNTIDIGAYEYH